LLILLFAIATLSPYLAAFAIIDATVTAIIAIYLLPPLIFSMIFAA